LAAGRTPRVLQSDGSINPCFSGSGTSSNTNVLGHAVTNASIGFSDPASHLTASIWARNLTDRQYRLYAVPVTSLGQEQQMFGPPRWYGVTLGYKW
jgi:outer membrane receptor protein involved in Fe transport